MEIQEILSTAIKEIDEAQVPEDLRQVAFGRVIDLLVSRSIGDVSGSARDLAPADGSILHLVASKLEMPLEQVTAVYYEENGDIGIGAAPAKLDSAKTKGTRQLALLVAAGRQASRLDDGWTKVTLIRKVCEDFGKFDSPNFATTILEMGDVFSFKGQGQRREVKVLRPGFEKAKQLVEALAGSS